MTTRLFNAFRSKKKQVADPFLVSEFEARQREFELRTEQMLRRVAEVESQERSVQEHLIQIDLLQHRVQDALQELATEKSYFERQFRVQRNQIRIAESDLERHELDLLNQAHELDQHENELTNHYRRFSEQKKELEIESELCKHLRVELETRNQDLDLVQVGLRRETEMHEKQKRQINEEFSNIHRSQNEISTRKERLRQQSEKQREEEIKLLNKEQELKGRSDEIACHEHEWQQQQEVFNSEKEDVQQQLKLIKEKKSALIQREAKVEEQLLSLSEHEQQCGLDIKQYEQLVGLQLTQEKQLENQHESIQAATQTLQTAHLALQQERNEFAQLQKTMTRQGVFARGNGRDDFETSFEDSPNVKIATVTKIEETSKLSDELSLDHDSSEAIETQLPASSHAALSSQNNLQSESPTEAAEWVTVDESNPVFSTDNEVQKYTQELLTRYRTEPPALPVFTDDQPSETVSDSEATLTPDESLAEEDHPSSSLEVNEHNETPVQPKVIGKRNTFTTPEVKLDAFREVARFSARSNIANAKMKHERVRFRTSTLISGIGCLATTSILYAGNFLSERAQPIMLVIGVVSLIYTLKSLSMLLTMRRLVLRPTDRKTRT